MSQLVAGLVVFFAIHTLTMLRGPRQRLLDRLGALPYRGLYSLVALGGFVLIVMGYGDAPRVAVWAPPAWLRLPAMALMLAAIVILVASYLPGHIKARLGNPMLIAVKTWAFAHLLVNGDLASMLLFGAFLAWSVVDLIAVKRQGRSARVAAPKALYDGIAVVAGSALFALIVVWGHVHIAGVPLVAAR